MPKGYWIARIDVRDPERYADYVATAAPAFAEFGARFLVRGGPLIDVEGPARTRNVVIEFPSVEAARACYESADYQAAKRIRQDAAAGEIVLVEGVE